MVIDPLFLVGTMVDHLCTSLCCELHELSTTALYLPLLDELALRFRVDITLPRMIQHPNKRWVAATLRAFDSSLAHGIPAGSLPFTACALMW